MKQFKIWAAVFTVLAFGVVFTACDDDQSLLEPEVTPAEQLADQPSFAVGDLDEPTSTWNVTPVPKDFPTDRACPDGSFLVRDAFPSVTNGDPKTLTETFVVDGQNVDITITTKANNAFDFDISNGTTPQMFVKGGEGSGYLLYQYDPPVLGATNTGPVSYDTDLHDGAGGGADYQDVSHLDFCIIPGTPFVAFDVTKTADGQYGRTVEWRLEKSVDPDTHEGFAGQVAGSSTWTVNAYKDVALGDYLVTGTITILNPNEFEVPFSVEDVLDDGTAAVVTCPGTDDETGVAPPAVNGTAGEIECSYSATPDNQDATLNTATVTPDDTDFEPTEATADIPWTENPAGFEEGTLTDPRFDFTQVIDDDFETTFPEDFTCSRDVNDYTDGFYTYDAVNTAYLNDNIDLEASATVTVNCYAPVITKDAAGAYDETWTWELTKTVEPTSQSGFPGDFLDWQWTVTVDESFVEENFNVSGMIYVNNPAGSPGAMTVSLVDELNDGTFATVDCGSGATSVEVASGAQGTCSYSADPDGRTATLNTATGTFNSIDFTATYDVVFDKTVLNGTATVDDDQESDFPVDLVAGDGGTRVWTETQDHTCSSDRADYGADGAYSETLYNTATLVSNGGQDLSADAETTYTCEASFVKIYKTTNDEPADPNKDIVFKLYEGTTVLETLTTLGTGAHLEFQTTLTPGDSYTICENPVPAGYTFEITIIVDGGNVLTYAGPPGASNPTGEIQCFDFVATHPDDLVVLEFNVENAFPGGAPRTPGYWKNWNTCSGGNQQYTAEALGGVAEGVFLLNDLLPQMVGDFYVNSCDDGVSVLDSRDCSKGKKMGSDAGYTLARAYLAALLNQDAGACVPMDTFDGMTFQEVLNAAQQVLVDNAFDCSGSSIGKRDADREYALYLYGIIDDYNNQELCDGDPSH